MASAERRAVRDFGLDPCHDCRELINRMHREVEGTGLCAACLANERAMLALAEAFEVPAVEVEVPVAAGGP